MKKEKNKKRQLHVYERDHIYPQSIAYYWDFFTLSPYTHYYTPNFWEVMAFKNGDIWWARDTFYTERAFREWFDKWLINSAERKMVFKKYEFDQQNIKLKIIELKQQLINKLTNNELLNIYHEAVKLALQHLEYAEHQVDLFDDYYAILFREYLEKENKAVDSVDLSTLLQPSVLSVSTKYQLDILKFSLLNNWQEKISLDWLEQYSWLRMGWDGTNELTRKDIEKEIMDCSELSITDRKFQIDKIINYESSVMSDRQRLIKKYQLADNVQNYFLLLDKFVLFHDYRKEIQMRCNQLIYRVLREIPQRLAVAYNNLMFYKNEEIENLLLENKFVDSNIIKQRQIGLTLLLEEGRITEYVGSTAVAKLEELVLSQMPQKTEEIKGLSASSGVYRGRAFVTRDAKEANKNFKKGDILITTMTAVELLPAMKLAGAIVTDDGGATCHAAIVSRELGVPCVVGTKVATKIIKSGDLIEVNANLGIINKL